ncbi:MAG: 16S rRNA (cytosine(1402)-N(4))-methyltransferase RsmH [Pseudomonadota bacterium]
MPATATPEHALPHIPVLLEEVLDALPSLAGATVLDGTYGGGGYSSAFLAAGARVIGVDRDPAALDAASPANGLTLVQGRFATLDEIAAEAAPEGLDAVVLDIGVSSMQLDEAERGFSFMRDGPLDMRMSSDGPSAAELVARLDEATLADILHFYGEERAARRIARAIVRSRQDAPINTTGQLSKIVSACLPAGRPGQAHPATRSFQAVRIAVNDELGELVQGLAAAERALKPGGVLAVVTFHSLEDRIVKRFFQMASATTAGGSRHGPEQLLPSARFDRPRRPVAPDPTELEANPRARSARLRSAVRTGSPPIPLHPRALGMPHIPGLERRGRA